MNNRLIVPLALTLLTGVFSAWADAPPSMQLKPGQWSYHSTITFTSGIMAGRTATNDWKTCARQGQAGEAAMKPHGPNGDTSCSAPSIRHDKAGYHTAMTCTTKSHGITSVIKENFTLTPGDGGESFKAHGIIDQEMEVPTMSSRQTQMTIDIQGHRTGTCPAG